MAIQISGTTVIDNSRNVNAGIGTFTALNVPPIPITFSPADGATNVSASSNIIITFSQSIQKGTGNITLRANSAGGTAFSTIGVSSSSVTISGGQVTIDPPQNIGFALTTFVVVDAGAFAGITTTSLSTIINTYSFITTEADLGDSYEGGILICKASPLRWVISPLSAEVSRNFYSRNDANTRAQSVSGCTGWFVPTPAQLQNPGFICRTYWYTSGSCYWTSTQQFGCTGWSVNFSSGAIVCGFGPASNCIRAFRCVTY
jgi:hypothetical protein